MTELKLFDINWEKTKGMMFFLLLLGIFFTGCATSPTIVKPLEPVIEVVETLPIAPPVSYEPLSQVRDDRAKVVENFNNPNSINQLNGVNRIYPSDPQKISAHYKREEPYKGSGKYYEIEYALNKDEQGTWRTDLKHLDISHAEWFSFLLKIKDREHLKKVALKVIDSFRNYAIVPLDKYFILLDESLGWGEIRIPKEDLKRVDFDKLKTIEIVISEKTEPRIEGIMAVDSFQFVGGERVYFHSLRDNLQGFPKGLLETERANNIAGLDNKELILEIARDTWKYFEHIIDKKTALPLDQIKVDTPQWIGDYTSPTNIGLYLTACVGAYDLGLITETEARKRSLECLKLLPSLPGWNGFHYNYYNTTTLEATDTFVSTVDSAWLAAGLIVARQAWGGEIALLASQELKKMDFGLLYDPDVGQLRIGYDGAKNELSTFHYGLLATEARVASFIGIGKGDIEKEHWFKIYRTLPIEWDWQSQVPQGREKEYLDQTVFAGYYDYKGTKVVPSWGGSLFEFLMPTMVMDEKNLAPEGLGLNNKIATEIHIDYALNEKQCGVWGLSPCSVPGNRYGGYTEFGVPALGAKGYKDIEIITPHVSFLALDVLPEKAIDNIRHLLTEYNMYGEYGFFDAIEIKTKKVSYKYLALDQAMIFNSCVNYLKDGSLKKRFHADRIAHSAEELLKMETFFE
jgi:hypothetical protein